MKISILLPYKENYTHDLSGAVSLFVSQISKISKFKNIIYIYGNTNSKKYLTSNYQNITYKKKIFQSSSKTYVGSFLKAKNVLADADNMLITTMKDLDNQLICEFIFGDEQGHNNKVTYRVMGEINKNNIKIKYNSNFFKTILNANKDMEGGELELSSEGLLRLHFSNEEIESEYFMVPQEDGIY